MSAVDVLLANLERVRSIGDGRWVASCPTAFHARGDRSAGLGIKQVDDRVLIHCPAGCSAADVVAAIGLGLADLFERPLSTKSVAPVRQPPFPRAMTDRLFKAATVLMLAADQLRFGKALNDADFETVQRAYAEIDTVVMRVATWPTAVRT